MNKNLRRRHQRTFAWSVSLLALLSGCMAHVDPVINTVTVDVPVAVSCVPKDLPKMPANLATPQALLKAHDAAMRYQMLAAFWTTFSPVLTLQAGVIASCQLAGAPPK